jgi:glycosyltransferase involved in cell wall biosynthesis
MKCRHQSPSVSVCIPAYNQPTFVERLLESIVNQRFSNFEVIVTDDSTNDSVEKIVHRYKKAADISYSRNLQCLGSPRNWNEGLKRARGKWIKLMHHDDWFSSGTSLEKFFEAAESDDRVPFVFSASNACNQRGQTEFTHWPSPDINDALNWPEKNLALRNLIGGPSATMFARHAINEFDENLIWLVDVDAYIRLLQKHRPLYIREPLVNVSLAQSGQLTSMITRNRPLMLAEHIYLFSKYNLNNEAEIQDYLYSHLGQLDFKEMSTLLRMRLVRPHVTAILVIYARVRLRQLLQATTTRRFQVSKPASLSTH